MRVLFLQQQPCIRALKYAVGLRTTRPDVQLGFAFQGRTLTDWYGSGDELFGHWWHLDGRPGKELGRIIADFSPDLIHSHNLPDTLTVLALEVAGDRIPVVHDVHDLQSLRRTPYENGFAEPRDPLALEKHAVEGSAALVTVSDELLDEIRARHSLPAHTLAFANYALLRDVPTALPRKRRSDGPLRIVYQGTLSTNGGHYDLREVFEAIVAEGVFLDIFPSRAVPAYRRLARAHDRMQYHDTLDPRLLLRELPRYDFGWAGFNSSLNGAHLDTVLPNKLYEYLGCGLPVLTLGHRALSRFVQENRVGLALARVEGLAERLAEADIQALRARVRAVRHRMTVEANIGAVAGLYDALVERGRTTKPA
jgi:glycosyltransferase involved in cell wall biosynthesis